MNGYASLERNIRIKKSHSAEASGSRIRCLSALIDKSISMRTSVLFVLVVITFVTSFMASPVHSAIDATFTTPAPTYELKGAGPNDITAGDFNSDGFIDLAVSSFGSATLISVLI